MFLAFAASVILTTTPVQQPQDQWTCTNQPAVAWCSQGQAAERDLAMFEVKRIEGRARRTFTVGDMNDEKVDNPWKSYADQVDKNWMDDCTGLSSTVIDLLARAGHPRSKLFRALVSTKWRGRADHMVGLVEINGRLFVVGDSLRNDPYPYEEARTYYGFKSISPVDQGTNWYPQATR